MGFFEDVAKWVENCKHGADPLEAMHGHLCGPGCWHWEMMPEEQKAKLLKAPWNVKKTEPK